jgi:hypothetical protein
MTSIAWSLGRVARSGVSGLSSMRLLVGAAAFASFGGVHLALLSWRSMLDDAHGSDLLPDLFALLPVIGMLIVGSAISRFAVTRMDSGLVEVAPARLRSSRAR